MQQFSYILYLLQIFVESMIVNETRSSIDPVGPVHRSVNLRLKFPYMRIRKVRTFVQNLRRRLSKLAEVDPNELESVSISSVVGGSIEVAVNVSCLGGLSAALTSWFVAVGSGLLSLATNACFLGMKTACASFFVAFASFSVGLPPSLLSLAVLVV